jgi:hypothetical protein
MKAQPLDRRLPARWSGAQTKLPEAREIARAVTVPQILRALGARVRNRKRADCPLCKGSSKETLAFNESLWKCHRCNEGGDVFSLVRAVHRCTFPDALRYVAEFAGIRLENSRSADLRRDLAEHRRQRERIDCAAHKLAQFEHDLRIEFRNRIHECDRVLQTPGPWSEVQWQRAQAASVLRDEYLLTAYTLLSFGSVAERCEFVLKPPVREGMVRDFRWRGYVTTDDGKQFPVLI